MNLPEGISQDTACVLIAIREVLDDPKWENDYLIHNLRENDRKRSISGNRKDGGFSGDITKVFRDANLFCDAFFVPTQEGNDDYFTIHVGITRRRWYRTTKAVFAIETESGGLHAIAAPLHLFGCFKKVVAMGIPKQGCIIDSPTWLQ